MDEKERIEKIMLKEEMNSAIFAAEIGIQGSTLSHILNGRNNPSLDVLKKILTAAQLAEAKSRISTFISNKTAAATR